MTESPRAQTYIRYAVGFVVSILVFSLIFVFLPFRYQGRIVEVVTFGDWPLEWAIRRHFDRKQTELAVIRQFMIDTPDIIEVTVIPAGLKATEYATPSESDPLDAPNILEALRSVDAWLVTMHVEHPHIDIFRPQRVRCSQRRFDQRTAGDHRDVITRSQPRRATEGERRFLLGNRRFGCAPAEPHVNRTVDIECCQCCVISLVNVGRNDHPHVWQAAHQRQILECVVSAAGNAK